MARVYGAKNLLWPRDLAVALEHHDVRDVVGRWVVGAAEVLADLVHPVEHARCPHRRVVELGIGGEQLVEAVPLRRVDDVAVEAEQLVDHDDVARRPSHPFQGPLGIKLRSPPMQAYRMISMEDRSRVPGGAAARTGPGSGAGPRRRRRHLPLRPARDPRVRRRCLQRRAARSRWATRRPGGSRRWGRAPPVSRSARPSPFTDRCRAARARAASSATTASATAWPSCRPPASASGSTVGWRRTCSSTASASWRPSETSTPCSRRRSRTLP